MLTPTMAMSMTTPENNENGITPDAPEALLTLQRRTADALAGYEKMVEKAEPEFRPVAERFRALHDRHNAALTAILLRHGQEPDADGTFMGTVNKAMVSLRAVFDEIDEDVMGSIRNGENHVLEAFDDAINASTLPGDVQDLRAMRDEITLTLQDTRHLD